MREHWFTRNADWPSFLLNIVVLGFAVYGVIQALQANRRAKETERKFFREGRFKPFDEALRRPRLEMQTAGELIDDLAHKRLSSADFLQEIDHVGPMILPAVLGYRKQLSAIDSEGNLGGAWEAEFAPTEAAILAAYDEAHDPGISHAARRVAAQTLVRAIRDGLQAMATFEFDQRQTWGRPFN